jgi:hypothetical protein
MLRPPRAGLFAIRDETGSAANVIEAAPYPIRRLTAKQAREHVLTRRWRAGADVESESACAPGEGAMSTAGGLAHERAQFSSLCQPPGHQMPPQW